MDELRHYKHKHFPNSALILIIIGIIFLLSNLDIINFRYYLHQYWPLLLVIFGVFQLISSKFRTINTPITFIVIGLILQLLKLDYFSWREIWRYWPVVLILIGIRMIARRSNRNRSPDENLEYIDTFVILGGADRKISSQNFKGGTAITIMGGTDLNFHTAKISSGEHHLSLTAIFGAIDIKVPKDWNIVVKATPILGTIENKRENILTLESQNKLILHCTAIMGGIEIRNCKY
ncbi:MAG: hypothetical protein DRH57_01960 [Candidatus Cloacimonadota bacterium]|nr:MAG: hypothetical protein DRH57_01960 [Candidatus Cloacimonadota bacterium]